MAIACGGLCASSALSPVAADPRKPTTCGLAAPSAAPHGAASGLDEADGLIAVWSDEGSLLLSDGQRLVPDGIALPSRLQPFPELARAAAGAADGVLSGGTLRLARARADRHGRRAGRAVLLRPDGTGEDLTLALLAAGAGYARWDGADPCAAAFLAAEDEARRARRGLWAFSAATARAADPVDVGARVGLFSVVEGQVRATGQTRDRLFLNFGQRWKDDFTIVLDRGESATILGDGLDPAMLPGTLVRVRGVIRADGGPAVFPRAPLELTVVEPMGVNHSGVKSGWTGVTQGQEQTEGEAR